MPDFTFIIPHANGRELLPRCLDSLLAQKGIGVEVVVVDNGSTDDSRDLIARDYPQVRLLAGEAKWGFARAINAGIQNSTSEWVVLFNNDAWLDPSWGMEMARAISEHPEFRIFAPQGISGRDPSLFYSLGEVFHHAIAIRVGYLQKRDSVQLEDLPKEVVGPSGYCGIYHRSVFERVGMLEEQFGSYFEDVDLNLRCSRAGFRCRLVKEAIVHHLGGAAWFKAPHRLNWQSGRNGVWFLKRHFALLRDPRVRSQLWHKMMRPVLVEASKGSTFHMVTLAAELYALLAPQPRNNLDLLPTTISSDPARKEIWETWRPFIHGVWKTRTD